MALVVLAMTLVNPMRDAPLADGVASGNINVLIAGLLFLGNHCPYVKHVAEEVVRLSAEYQAQGVGVMAIRSNDVAQFPEDGPARMGEVVAAIGFTAPYRYDETQGVAKAYHAACAPDFFLFDADRRLAHRGQLDGARPGKMSRSAGGISAPPSTRSLPASRCRSRKPRAWAAASSRSRATSPRAWRRDISRLGRRAGRHAPSP
jgi:hypothetical protein